MATTVQATSGAALKRRMRRKSRALPVVITVALAGGLGWYGWTKSHPAEDPNSKLLTAVVTRGDLIEAVSATGSVTAQTGAQVKIGSQITGTIKKLNADIGTYVKAGDVIAELNLPDLQAQVAQSEASLAQAQGNLAQAQTHYAQQQSGVGMQRTQTSGAIDAARADLRAAQARLNSALAAAQQQSAQTPQDVRRGETGVGVAQAALSTAQSNLRQTQASADLQIANAREDLNQSRANSLNSTANLKRQGDLLAKGFVAQSVVDAAQAQASVDTSKVQASQQNVQLIQAKVTADLQTARDQVTQAQQNVAAAQAALTSSQAGSFTVAARQADVQNARAAVNQAQANLQTALGNTSQNILKGQDVQQAEEAVKTSQSAVSVAKSQVDYYKAQLDKAFIRSPITGTVLQLASQQGETLAAGLSSPTLIVVADLNRLQVDTYVDETDIGKIKIGQQAQIIVDAFPKTPIQGHVAKVASGSTIQQGVITYDVTLALDHPPVAPDEKKRRDLTKLLKPDMTASVTIQTGKREGVLLVPAEAVKMGAHGSTINVLSTVDGKKEIKPVPIKTGGSDGVNTEVREGVKEGQIIVRAGMQDPNKRQGPGSPFGGGGKGK